MSDIPVTHRAFCAWRQTNVESWPGHIVTLATQADLTLWMIENNPKDFLDAVPTFRAQVIKDLTAFAEAYGAWKTQTDR